jgi:hypothetical protein
MKVTPKLIVRRALQLFGKDGQGWCKGSLDNHQGQHCTLGALDKVTKELRAGDETFRAARELVRASLAQERKLEQGLSLMTFNDRSSTSFADIKRVFNRAIRGVRKPRQATV